MGFLRRRQRCPAVLVSVLIIAKPGFYFWRYNRAIEISRQVGEGGLLRRTKTVVISKKHFRRFILILELTGAG